MRNFLIILKIKMNIKGIKKGDIVKIKTADGETKIMRVEKASKKEIKGDTYEFEK